MKRILPWILVLALLLCGCGGEGNESTGPAGSGASGETQSTEAPEGILEEKETNTVYKLVVMTVMNENGEELRRVEYTYDDFGFCTAEQEYSNIGGGTCSRVHTSDGSGLPVDTLVTEADGSQYKIAYTYDEQGRVTREAIFRDGTLTEKTEYTYDDRGNYLSIRQYYGEELVMDYSFSYTYDANGNAVEEDEYQFGEPVYHVTTTYDNQGREVSSVSTVGTGEVQSRRECSWDGLTETRCYYSGDETEPYMITVATYDDAGNVVFEQTRQGDMVISTTEYVYEPFEVNK